MNFDLSFIIGIVLLSIDVLIAVYFILVSRNYKSKNHSYTDTVWSSVPLDFGLTAEFAVISVIAAVILFII